MDNDKSKTYETYEEYFYNYLFPIALEYGMTSDEFWKDDPNLFASYRTFYINKKKNEYKEHNYKSWLNGLYIHDGNSILTQKLYKGIARLLGSKPQSDKRSYPTRPYELYKNEEIDNVKNDKENQQKEYFNSMNYYASLKKKFIEKIKER